MEASNSIETVEGNGYMQLANNRLKFGRPRQDWFISDIDFIWQHITPGSRVLDYGCGNGSLGFLGYDERSQIQIVGMDEKDKENKYAKYHYKKEVEGTFDLIIYRHGPEHLKFETGELRGFLEWCYSISNKCITVSPHPSRWYDFKQDPTHYTRCDNDFYLAICEDAGWKVKDVLLTDVRVGSKVFFLNRMAISAFEGVAPLFSHIVVMEH